MGIRQAHPRVKKIITRDFFERDTPLVAQELLGKTLIRNFGDRIISGLIVEAEAYDGEQDLACHAHVGRTRRNEVMYGPAGHAYVYFTYGMHWMLNCVTGSVNYPAAVLIRALIPIEGLDIIKLNRKGRPESEWSNGPAKLCQALKIDGSLNGTDICNKQNPICITEGINISTENIKITRRVGIDGVPEPWLGMPWRFVVAEPSSLDIK